MRRQRTDGLETRRRLLDAASMVFAEKGFWETTNADICGKAGINTAAVNYHFGGKEELYIEAWKYSFDKSLKKHPPDGGIGPEASPQERLRGRILSFMQRVTDPRTYELQITHKEMACPTGLLSGVLHSSLKNVHEGFKSVVAELLGEDAGEQEISLTYLNIVDMCFGVVHQLRRGKMLRKRRNSANSFSQKDVEAYANHVLLFSLAGIRGIREQSKRGKISPTRNRRKTRNSRSKS